MGFVTIEGGLAFQGLGVLTWGYEKRYDRVYCEVALGGTVGFEGSGIDGFGLQGVFHRIKAVGFRVGFKVQGAVGELM